VRSRHGARFLGRQNWNRDSLEAPRRSAARKHRWRRRRESLCTDSRVLRVGRTVNTVRGAPRAKLFSYDERGRVAEILRANVRTIADGCRHYRRSTKNSDDPEVPILSALSYHADICWKISCAKFFISGTRRRRLSHAFGANDGRGS